MPFFHVLKTLFRWISLIFWLVFFNNKNIFKISEHFIKVEFPFSVPLNLLSTNNGDINGNINGDINRVLLLLEKQPSITAKQMAEVLQISPRKVSRIIKELKEKEIIVRIDVSVK